MNSLVLTNHFATGSGDMQSETPDRADRRQTGFETYFAAHVRGWGIFQDRFGKVRQEFTVEMRGDWDGDIFVLNEDFNVADGTRQHRTWNVRILGEGRYEATADDIVGVARGKGEGSHLRWRYDMKVPVGGRAIRLRFDDRMFFQDDGVLINVSDATKWGFRIGRLVAFYMRPG